MHSVMLCVVMEGNREECCIDTAVMCLQMPFLREYKSFHVHFAGSHAEALKAFETETKYDILACVPGSKANIGFVTAALDHGAPLVIGLSVVPQINWGALERGEACCEYDIPRSHLDRIDPRTGYARLLTDAFDMTRQPPECFVMRRSYQQGRDAMLVDTRNVFKSTGRIEFGGCIKRRYIRSNS